MKSFKVLLLATAVAYLPMSAGAFGFGASRYEYPPGPPGAYGPYGAQPPQGSSPRGHAPGNMQRPGPAPYGPPPNARNVQGMWGSGPGMSWGSPDRDAWYKEVEERRKRTWRWTDDWTYESPYKDAQPWVSPFDKAPGKVPSK